MPPIGFKTGQKSACVVPQCIHCSRCIHIYLMLATVQQVGLPKFSMHHNCLLALLRHFYSIETIDSVYDVFIGSPLSNARRGARAPRAVAEECRHPECECNAPATRTPAPMDACGSATRVTAFRSLFDVPIGDVLLDVTQVRFLIIIYIDIALNILCLYITF